MWIKLAVVDVLLCLMEPKMTPCEGHDGRGKRHLINTHSTVLQSMIFQSNNPNKSSIKR